MRAFRSHLATLLLLCFMRVLVPDAWVLTLHAHEHTLHEPAQGKREKALLTAQHKHCQTDHFYNAFFQSARPLEIICPTFYATSQTSLGTEGEAVVQPIYSCLRGPPAG